MTWTCSFCVHPRCHVGITFPLLEGEEQSRAQHRHLSPLGCLGPFSWCLWYNVICYTGPSLSCLSCPHLYISLWDILLRVLLKDSLLWETIMGVLIVFDVMYSTTWFQKMTICILEGLWSSEALVRVWGGPKLSSTVQFLKSLCGEPEHSGSSFWHVSSCGSWKMSKRGSLMNSTPSLSPQGCNLSDLSLRRASRYSFPKEFHARAAISS